MRFEINSLCSIINFKKSSLKLTLFLAFIFLSFSLFSQKVYRTSSGELIFSRSVNNSPFTGTSSKTRVSTFFHYNINYHYNFSNFLGCFAGASISNIGFKYSQADTIYKRRAYTLGFPLAFKAGKVNSENFLFAGAQVEFPFHYKQKKIFDQQKSKYSAFFDDRVNKVLPSFFAGIQFQGGVSLKAKLYLTDFLNTEFEGVDFGTKINYRNSDSRLFLISLSYNIKENKIKKIIKNEDRYAYLKI